MSLDGRHTRNVTVGTSPAAFDETRKPTSDATRGTTETPSELGAVFGNLEGVLKVRWLERHHSLRVIALFISPMQA